MQERIEYLQQVNVQYGPISNQAKPSSLYEINLKQEYNSRTEENYQSLTNQYEKISSQCVKPTYFSTNLARTPTSHDEEPSRWLPKQVDSPLETENNTEELLKKVNEALETREEKNKTQELFNKINDILKLDGRIRNKASKMRVDGKHSESRDFFLPREDDTRSNDFLQEYEKNTPFDNNRRMFKNVDRHHETPRITDGPVHEDIQRNNRDKQTHALSFYLSNKSNTVVNLEEQFTGASLEYWGNHSIGSIEHSLTQWNILKSPNESNWLQHSFNQSNWLRNNTASPNLRQRNLYA